MEQQNQAQTSIDDLFVVQPPPSPVVEQPAQVHQPAPDPAQVQPQVPAPQPAPQAPHMVPLPELLEQRHRAQIAELKHQQTEARLNEIQAHIEAQQRAAYQAYQAQQPPLDPVGDPEGFARAMLQENAALKQNLQSIVQNMPAHMTEYLVRDKYGDEAVDAAVKEAHKAGLGPHFMKQSNPYKALMQWRSQQDIAQQVGPDLKAWETKKEQEIEARVLAKYGVKQPVAAASAAPQNLPPSLATATNAGNANPLVPEPSAIFENMFARKR